MYVLIHEINDLTMRISVTLSVLSASRDECECYGSPLLLFSLFMWSRLAVPCGKVSISTTYEAYVICLYDLDSIYSFIRCYLNDWALYEITKNAKINLTNWEHLLILVISYGTLSPNAAIIYLWVKSNRWSCLVRY